MNIQSLTTEQLTKDMATLVTWMRRYGRQPRFRKEAIDTSDRQAAIRAELAKRSAATSGVKS